MSSCICYLQMIIIIINIVPSNAGKIRGDVMTQGFLCARHRAWLCEQPGAIDSVWERAYDTALLYQEQGEMIATSKRSTSTPVAERM